MRFTLKFLGIYSVFSLSLIPAYALMEENLGSTEETRPSLFQTQTNILIPENRDNPSVALARYTLVTYLTKTYGDKPENAPVHAAVTDIVRNLGVDQALIWPVYQATYNFYRLLSQSLKDTKHVMAWTVKFIKPGMDDQAIMHVAGLIHGYLDDNSPKDCLLTAQELSDPHHPLPTLAQNSQQWAETGEDYIKKLRDALAESVRGWETL